MLIHNADITGSLTINGIPFNTGSFSGSFTGIVAGTTATASYVEYNNVANKPALVSGSSQITYSDLTGIPSGIVSGSAQVAGFGIFATTGSNQFNGSQVITGSLTVTGQVVAQTLNVQQVTSSVVYSSGSNVFGNELGNTQQFTGSLQVSGSSHYLLGSVGIGTDSPEELLHIFNSSGDANLMIDSTSTGGDARLMLKANSSGFSQIRFEDEADANVGLLTYSHSDNSMQFRTNDAERMRITSAGNVGIGTTSPSGKFNSFISATRQIAHNALGGDFSVISDNNGNPVLYVKGTGTADLLQIFDNTTQVFTVKDGGNVGIGTDNPSRQLVVSNGGANGIEIASNISGGNSEIISYNRSTAAYTPLNFVSSKFTFETGNVGIGATSLTTAKLEVVGAIPSFFTADSQADSPTYGGSIFYRNRTGANQGNGIAFQLNNASNIGAEYGYIGGLIETNTTDSQNGSIIFAPASSGNREVRMSITSGGYLRLTTGGIQFNGDTAAANALDDYEEGTWTPTYIGSLGGSVGGYSIQLGTYIKIGNVVTLRISIRASKGTISGNISIGGIPYAGSGLVNMTPRRRFQTDFQLAGAVSSSQIELVKIDSNSLDPVFLTDADFSAVATTSYNDINTTITYLTI